ncbi:MAG TPA: 3D domain-containing protein, partial [Vicinamibacterales bacterium]|nr:3D domain-containing protein [Vicinamibacterales bacterium]
HAESAKKPNARSMRVTATAYCQGGRTQSGVPAHSGIIAADPRVLPAGSIVKILDGPTTGIYTVMDTGAAIKGRRIDVYIPSCARAKKFGRRTVNVIVMRRGWDPAAGDSNER